MSYKTCLSCCGEKLKLFASNGFELMCNKQNYVYSQWMWRYYATTVQGTYTWTFPCILLDIGIDNNSKPKLEN